jgi:hypothetical protein
MLFKLTHDLKESLMQDISICVYQVRIKREKLEYFSMNSLYCYLFYVYVNG